MRFDVHVRYISIFSNYVLGYLLIYVDQSPKVPNHTIPRCPTNTLRIYKARRSPHILKP
jgi:hypothetical protein